MQYTRFHFNIRNWKDTLKNNIERCVALCEQYPDDPRYEATLKEANVYEMFVKILEGDTNPTISSELWEFMTKISKESDSLKLKSDKKVERKEEVMFEPITDSVESQGETDSNTLAEALTQATEEVKPKKTRKKVKQE